MSGANEGSSEQALTVDEERNGIFVSAANEGSGELASPGSEHRNRLGRVVAALSC